MARKEKKYHFIYKTTNLITGKYYIGMHSTDDLNDGYLGSGKYLRRSINKYGKENHVREVLEFVNNRELLAVREKQIITEQHLSDVSCMNLMSGGTGGFVSVEVQLRRSIAGNKKHLDRLNNDEEYRMKFISNLKEGLKKAHLEGKLKGRDGGPMKGKKFTEDHKEKIGLNSKEKQIGELNSQYGTCWVNNGNENRKIKKDELDLWINDGWFVGKYSSIPEEIITKMTEFYKAGNSYQKVADKFGIPKTTLRKYLNLCH